jgi:N,N-dimethylformamidase beta subunit-like, C-terminal
MGAQTTSPANGTADWTCTNEKHWLFAGTGMKNGEAFKGLVGWEHHGPPLGEVQGLEVLARGPVFSRGRAQNTEYTATIYPGPKGNLVFNAATIWWSDGLSEPPGYLRPSAHGGTPPGPDERVQRITKNLFERFLSG